MAKKDQAPQSNTEAATALGVAVGPLDAHGHALLRLALTLAVEIDTGDEAPSAALVNQYRATLSDLAGTKKGGAGAGDPGSWILSAVPS
jgi:hypothetical protein